MDPDATPPAPREKLRRFLRSSWTRRIALFGVGLTLLFGVLFCTLLFNPLEADHPGTLVELVPESVSLYAGATDLAGGWSGWSSSRVRQQMGASESWRRFFASPLWRNAQRGIGLEGLRQALERRAGSLLTDENLLELLGREVAVAARFDGSGRAEGLLLARVGFRGKLAIAGLLRAVRLGLAPGELLPFDPPVARIGQGASAVFIGRLSDVICVSTSRSLIEEVLLLARLQGEGSLARSTRFAAALRGEGHGVRVFADFERADKLLGIGRLLEHAALPFPLPLLLYLVHESVDLGALERVSGRFYFVDPAYDRIFWEGSLSFAAGRLSDYHQVCYRQRPHIFRSFDVLPRQALLARALTVDPQLLWRFARRRMSRAVRDWFVELDRLAGAAYGVERSALDSVLLPLLGEEFALLLTRIDYLESGAARGAEYPLPGLLLLVRSPDAAALARRLDQLFARPHQSLSTGAVSPARYAALQYSKFPLRIGFPSLEPCYGATGEFFVLASHPLALQQLHDVQEGVSRARRVEKVSRTRDNLRLHVDFEQTARVLHDLAPKFAEEIVGGTRSMQRIRAEMAERYGPGVSEAEITRVRQVRTEIRAERMRKGLEQYRILDHLDLEWSALRGHLVCQARLGLRF